MVFRHHSLGRSLHVRGKTFVLMPYKWGTMSYGSAKGLATLCHIWPRPHKGFSFRTRVMPGGYISPPSLSYPFPPLPPSLLLLLPSHLFLLFLLPATLPLSFALLLPPSPPLSTRPSHSRAWHKNLSTLLLNLLLESRMTRKIKASGLRQDIISDVVTIFFTICWKT